MCFTQRLNSKQKKSVKAKIEYDFLFLIINVLNCISFVIDDLYFFTLLELEMFL